MTRFRGDSGQSQVDFMVGFTIFIFSLIVVANMVPSLLVGLQRTTAIDYDAVAYRTAVILAEDPGEPSEPDDYQQGNPTGWDYYSDLDEMRRNAPSLRFGLAQSRDTPNILSPRKIARFFDPGLKVTDYRNNLTFGTYGYNISLINLDTDARFSTGSPYPEGRYGYIRRYVKIRNFTNATIDNWTHPEFNLTEDSDTATRTFDILIDGQILYRDQAKLLYSPGYVIDPTRDPLIINITGLRYHLNRSGGDWSSDPLAATEAEWTGYAFPLPCVEHSTPPTSATLKSITFEHAHPPAGTPPIICDGDNPNVVVYYGYDSNGDGYDDGMRRLEGDPTNFVPPAPGVQVANSINIEVKNLDDLYMNVNQGIRIRLTFEEPSCDTLEGGIRNPPHTLLSGTFLYDYNVLNVTQPALSPGILEVAIW
ncbi:MAG: hypothetical protein LUQ64_03955 [Methanomicrobiales archaeon]|nr:hypothetical protein [Methanomicrobiales archaeon]